MYIFELLINYLKGEKYTSNNKYDPLSSLPDGLEEKPEDCEHLFMPLDSTNEMFACKYCGLIVPADKLRQDK